jgi:transposase
MGIADRNGLPIALYTHPANTHEVKLVKDTLENRFTEGLPQRLVADKAYDSDPLDKELLALGIQLISPHRGGRRRKSTQDGRALRRYKRRWKIERLWAWIHNYRRCVVRWDYYPENFLGFIQLAAISLFFNRYF